MTQIIAAFPCYNECVRVPATEDQPALLMTAVHGDPDKQFCDREFYRVTAALDLAPKVIEHVVSMAANQWGSDDRVDGSREAPLPFNVQAFNDANETYRRLVYWGRVWADRLNAQAPGPAMRSWRNRSGEIVGLPANISASGARYASGVLATWLTLRLEDVFGQQPDDVLYFHDELKDVFRVNARWPQESRPEFSQMPCPDDSCKGRIAVYPPQEFGDDQMIKCERCGRIFDEARYTFYLGVFTAIKSEENPTKRHLLKKYGAA